jgi:hypothetical protein
MKRGLIALLGTSKVSLLATFERAGTLRPVFLKPFARRLQSAGMDSLAGGMVRPLERWCGDRLTVGLGEILVPDLGG